MVSKSLPPRINPDLPLIPQLKNLRDKMDLHDVQADLTGQDLFTIIDKLETAYSRIGELLVNQ